MHFGFIVYVLKDGINDKLRTWNITTDELRAHLWIHPESAFWVGRGDRGVRPHHSPTWSTNQQSLWGQKAGRLHSDTNTHDTGRTDRRVRHCFCVFSTGSLHFCWTRRRPPDCSSEFQVAATLNHTVSLALFHWRCRQWQVTVFRGEREGGVVSGAAWEE